MIEGFYLDVSEYGYGNQIVFVTSSDPSKQTITFSRVARSPQKKESILSCTISEEEFFKQIDISEVSGRYNLWSAPVIVPRFQKIVSLEPDPFWNVESFAYRIGTDHHK